MKSILIIGLGRFGRHAALKFSELGLEVMVVDHNEGRVEAITQNVTNALIGDSTRQDFLASLGIPDFDVCLVTIGDNFQNSLETTSLLKEMGAKLVISRASRDVHAKFLLRNGADAVVYPEKQLAEWTAIKYSSDHILDYLSLGNEYSVFEIALPPSWEGKSLSELDVRKKFKINVVGIKENENIIFDVNPSKPLSSDHVLLVLGKDSDVVKYL